LKLEWGRSRSVDIDEVTFNLLSFEENSGFLFSDVFEAAAILIIN
jgi:hypothetical protein